MCNGKHIVLFLSIALFGVAVPASRGQLPPHYTNQLHADTAIVPINYREQSARSDAFYDTLRLRKYKNAFTRFLFRSLIRGRNSSDEGTPSLDFKQNRDYFELFAGKRITGIHWTLANVFSPRDTTRNVSWLQRTIDKIHIQTKPRQLAQNLLFQVGDTLNPYVLGINEELLRSLPNLATAYFVVMPDRNDSTGVSIHIFARDNWSIGADVNWGSQEKSLSVFDRNFLGTGDELKLKVAGDKQLSRFGFGVEYTARNLLGHFTDATIGLGSGGDQNMARFAVVHPFILPTGWGFGFTADRTYRREEMTRTDTSHYIERFFLGGWGGRSWCLNWQNGTNVYVTASLDRERYLQRPEVSETLNPYYHHSTQFLVGFGFSRRNYFQGNMIYGFGRTEDIPYGFRFELVGGRQWEEELGGRDYWGVRGYWGNLIRNSYLEASLAFGSYFTRNYRLQQSVATGHIKYFTPLLRVRTSYIRQFGTLSATMGFHRLEGEREALRYENRWGRGIRGLSADWRMTGYNRLTIGSETVVFTPLFLYHFRFAFFLCGDVGWLGYDNNLFRNRFTGAIGAGGRIRNERLIFNNVEIRFGYAFNRPPDVGYRTFSISSEPDFKEIDFAPEKPQVIPYR